MLSHKTGRWLKKKRRKKKTEERKKCPTTNGMKITSLEFYLRKLIEFQVGLRKITALEIPLQKLAWRFVEVIDGGAREIACS